MVIDLPLLDRILDDEVVAPSTASTSIATSPRSPTGGRFPPARRSPRYVFRRVAARLPAGVVLERVRILEDPTLYADCTGLA